MKHVEFKKAGSARPVGTDLYALLGLEERFAIDLDELERRYLERSREVHPDRFVNAAASQRVSALQQSMELNNAFKTLKKPMTRAEYLLRRHGVAIGDNEQLDPGFLMEMLEMREELQEARAAGQSGRVRELERAMLKRRDEAMGRVAVLFAALERSAGSPGSTASAGAGSGAQAGLDEIKQEIILLRYIHRYLEAIEDDLEEDDV